MQAVLLMGIQATGKSTFARRFVDTHVRINLDMLHTRHRELAFLTTCIETQQPFVVDNTNPSRIARSRYIEPARSAGFEIVGYYLQSKINDALLRNEQRSAELRVPDLGIRGTSASLELPSLDEGFDTLHYVRIDEATRGFVVEAWSDAI